MKAVIIGAGQIAGGLDSPEDEAILTHAHAYKANPDTELIGVCDTDESSLKEFTKKWETKAFNSAKEMIDECAPDIISICSSTQTHSNMLNLALESKSAKVILCEKPFVSTKEEFDEINRLLEKNSKKLFINFIRRYDPSFIKLAEIIKSGELGSIQSFQGRFSKGLIHNGSHMLELIEWLIGSISKIRILDLHKSESDFLGQFYVHSENANGILTNQEATNYDHFELDIMLSGAKIAISDQGRSITILKPEESKIFAGYSYLQEHSKFSGTLERNMENSLNFALANDSHSLLQTHLNLSAKLLHIAKTLHKSSSIEFA